MGKERGGGVTKNVEEERRGEGGRRGEGKEGGERR